MLSTYSLTAEQNEILNLARDFASREILPQSSTSEKESWDRGPLLEKICQSGLVNTRIPEEYGGPGLSLLESCLIAEQLSFACAGIASLAEASELAITVLLIAGSLEQKKAYLSPLATKGALAGISLSGTGDSLVAKEESGYFILNGHCPLVLNASVSSWFLVSCSLVTANSKSGLNEATLHYFIVPSNHSGLTLSAPLQMLGRKAADARSISFEKVKLEPLAKINTTNGRGDSPFDCFPDNCLLLAAGCVGLSQSAFEHAKNYALSRKTFGVAIASHQAIAFMLADMATNIEAARLMVHQAARCKSGDQDLFKLAECARIFALDMIGRITIDSVQIFGGYGYAKDYPVEKLMRDAKTYQTIYASTIDGKEKLGRHVLS